MRLRVSKPKLWVIPPIHAHRKQGVPNTCTQRRGSPTHREGGSLTHAYRKGGPQHTHTQSQCVTFSEYDEYLLWTVILMVCAAFLRVGIAIRGTQ